LESLFIYIFKSKTIHQNLKTNMFTNMCFLLLQVSCSPRFLFWPGPSPKLKLESKGLDQSRQLNSHITTTTTKLSYQFQEPQADKAKLRGLPDLITHGKQSKLFKTWIEHVK
jgi:hypothetical protein